MMLPESLHERVAYFDYGEVDRGLLAELGPTLEKHADFLAAAFYRHLLAYPPLRHLLRDPELKERLLGLQRLYLVSLAGPEIDGVYLAQRQGIGEVHERIGLAPGWYLGAYALYLSLLTPLVCERFATEPQRGERALVALQKLLLFDASLALETCIGRRESEFEYRNAEALLRDGAQRALSLGELEDLYIDEILRRTGGNKVRAALLLGIDRKTLYRRAERKVRVAAKE